MTAELPEHPGRVPVGELRALVEEWEQFTEVIDWNDYNKGVTDGVNGCADELQKVIDNYE